MVQHVDLSGDDLDTRAREVLREIIMQHVATGEAISSRSLAKCGRFQLSPASLRNVMADLEDLGYLAHPHTSAGRVPTDRGYRFFINYLMKSRVLSQRERETIDEQVSHGTEIDHAPHENDLYVEGAASILTKPEFFDTVALRKTFLALQEKEKLIDLLNSCLTEEGLQILIGSESDFTHVHNFSIVAKSYGSHNAPLGVVGIIGPMRMEYARMAPLVDYIGRALSRKIEEEEQA